MRKRINTFKRALLYILFPIIFLYTKLIQKLFPIKILSEEETRKKILEGGSISRIGDGEINIALGRSKHRFQDHDEELARRLKEIMALDLSTTPKFYVAMPPMLSTYKGYNMHNVVHWVQYNATRRSKIYRLIDNKQWYCDACAFRIMGLKKDNATQIKRRMDEVKAIWEGKRILVVEADYYELSKLGENLCLGVNDDFLSGAAEVERIIAPARNAFSKYDEILNSICRNFQHDMVLLILGMTATVLAYDLYLRGIRAIDFGQTSGSYDCAKKTYFSDEPNGECISIKEWQDQIIERIEL